MISAQGLTKLYGDFTAVRGVTFDVAPGEILGLVGPNGAGKTTTLRCLAGIITPTNGTIAIAGHTMDDDPIAAKRALAFIPDEPHLFEYLSVEEHLRFIARMYGVPDPETRLPALLAEMELSEKGLSLPGELSRGMRQKVVIGCGLVRHATTLLFDEPLTGLDPIGIRRMRDTIRRRAREGASILVSSHLLHLVEEVCS
ncbi:MAG TPA: ABC transporter ATP-binding protein, partial [Gemmatimonadaceae bacterium]|nr:ABC transporter ATP-binding protein [Gemmatimonadaceae bacterium]